MKNSELTAYAIKYHNIETPKGKSKDNTEDAKYIKESIYSELKAKYPYAREELIETWTEEHYTRVKTISQNLENNISLRHTARPKAKNTKRAM